MKKKTNTNKDINNKDSYFLEKSKNRNIDKIHKKLIKKQEEELKLIDKKIDNSIKNNFSEELDAIEYLFLMRKLITSLY